MVLPKDRVILQIIPADGWFAEYEGNNNEEIWVPLAFWALCRGGPDYEDDETFIEGYDDPGGVSADGCSNFKCYIHETGIDRVVKRKKTSDFLDVLEKGGEPE
jgi:hypothetical protein